MNDGGQRESVQADVNGIPVADGISAVGGSDAIFVDPVHIPVNYDYVYATDVQ